MAKALGTTEPPKVNIIAKGTAFEGTITAECDIRVSGSVVGTLKGAARVVISQGGVVEGDLYAADASIAGAAKGKIFVKERLMLKSTASIEGAIRAGRLVIEEGAKFNGECQMGAVGQALNKNLEITKSARTASAKDTAMGRR